MPPTSTAEAGEGENAENEKAVETWPANTVEYLQQRIMGLGKSFDEAAEKAGECAINVTALWEAKRPIEMFELCEGLMDDCPGGLEFAKVASLMGELERVRDEHPDLKECSQGAGYSYSQEAGADFRENYEEVWNNSEVPGLRPRPPLLADDFPVDTEVVLHGFTNDGFYLNGKVGVVKAAKNATGHYLVQMRPNIRSVECVGESFLILAVNLRHHAKS